jgi:hypothetical protein
MVSIPLGQRRHLAPEYQARADSLVGYVVPAKEREHVIGQDKRAQAGPELDGLQPTATPAVQWSTPE